MVNLSQHHSARELGIDLRRNVVDPGTYEVSGFLYYNVSFQRTTQEAEWVPSPDG